MPQDHMLFKCTHQSLNANFYLLGIFHQMQYQELPSYCRDLLESADVVFHEGMNGVVFADPYWIPRLSFIQAQDSNSWWLDQLEPRKQELAQLILNHYCNKVKRLTIVPDIKDLQPWAIETLIDHFEYFVKGQEVDHSFYWKRLQKGKKIISLDKTYLMEHIKKQVIYFAKLKAEGRFIVVPDDLFDLIEPIEEYFRTGKTVPKIVYNYDYDNPMYPIHENFFYTTEYANNWCRKDHKIVIERNQNWFEQFCKYFKNIKQSRSEQLALMCGSAHLPDMVARLMCAGFTVSKVMQTDITIPIDMKEKNLIFAFKKERETFSYLRDQIIGNKQTWLEEMNRTSRTEEQRKKYTKAICWK